MSISTSPSDQADGLRRLFAGRAKRYVALASNPLVPFHGVAIERLAAACTMLGHHVLVVDAAETAPRADEACAIDLALGVQPIAPTVSYLAAGGLPLRFVDARGSCARLLDELSQQIQRPDVILVHAGASDLTRIFQSRQIRPLLMTADHPASVKHAYASMKTMAARSGWMSADLLVVNPPTRRVPAIATGFARCADQFLGVAVAGWEPVDPACTPGDRPEPTLTALVAAQLGQDEGALAAPMPARAQHVAEAYEQAALQSLWSAAGAADASRDAAAMRLH